MPDNATNGFPKNIRLRTAPQFKKVYDNGAKRVSRSFVLFALGNGLEYSRFGLTTPRKLGKANERNRVKRRVREILRTSRRGIPPGFDYVLNPRRSSSERSLTELRTELMVLLGVKA